MKKTLLPFAIVAAISSALAGCEGYRTAEGTVVDKTTHTPIDSVYVDVTSGKDDVYTDSTGTFNVENPLGGCSFGCRDITIEFSKPGYKKQVFLNPDEHVVVGLERE